ncbi:DUF1360 domain-containing protein [Parageobacillus sp. VR-IP]|uniref:DUF1360 domain-containing protein n=1 Tax=Parageobacillus sp. VR-IP TaxID=2742205 RepID=UPI0015823CAA|nr:DUF1360 domain-containing protein [Parageobacillus sp. VR-IP]NUK28795.1 DUF1360 domain-containing protein [Parageobacillus sp. VR-IP]
MTATELFLFILATFRLTRLLMYDAITSFLRKPFHEITEETLPDGTVQSFLHIKGSGLRHWIGELLSCYWCTGIWCAAILYIGDMLYPVLFQPLLIILAIAGGASLIEWTMEKADA